MKKFLLSFFFIIGFASLHADANTLANSRGAYISSADKHSHSSLEDFDYDIAEIENCLGVSGSVLKTNQVSQRSVDFYSCQPDQVFTELHLFTDNQCCIVELFGNNYLSHNYPFHSLW